MPEPVGLTRTLAQAAAVAPQMQACIAMTYDYEAGTAAGSDHAVVRAEFLAESPAEVGRS